MRDQAPACERRDNKVDIVELVLGAVALAAVMATLFGILTLYTETQY
jgi:hypothetical protein